MSKCDDRLPIGEIGRKEVAEMYSWDAAAAIAAQEKWVADHPDVPRGPLFWWNALGWLDVYREQYKEGNNNCILLAIFECASTGLPIPEWCANALIKAHREIKQHKANSWDDVFDTPQPRDTHLGAKLKQKETGFIVYEMVKNRPFGDLIDDALFDDIGKELGISKTAVKDYYYSFQERLKKVLPQFS